MVVRMRVRGLTAASLLCLAPGVGAQIVTPGVAEDFLRDTPRITPAPAPVPNVTPRPAPPARPKANIQINGVTFSGSTLYTQEQLQAIAAPLVKQRMSLAEINEIAQAVTDRMRSDGYLVASAVVPAQKIQQGVVRIDILEGKLDKVRFAGNQRYSDERLKAYLAPLLGEPVLTNAAMERSLLMLNELPGVTARGNLSPAENFGASNLEVDITERRYRAALGFNNHGSPELGRARADASLDIYNPLRIGDHANLRLIESQGGLLGLGRLSYDFALAPALRVNLAAARVNYRVAGSLNALDLSGNSMTREASLAYAWVRARSTNLTLGTGVRDVRTYQQALGQSLGGTAVRAGFVNLTGYTTRGGGLTSGVVTMASNGRGQDAPGTAGTGIKLKTDMDVTHARTIVGDFEISQRIALTLSPDTLPDTEKFSLGGPDSVRAFPIAQLRGDQGLLSVTELRRRFTFAGTQSYVGVFFDHGIMELRQPGLPAARDTLSGAGVTVSVVHDRLRIKLDYARALGSDAAADGRRSRVWVSGTWLF